MTALPTSEIVEAGDAVTMAAQLGTDAPTDMVLELLDRMEVIQQRAKQAKEAIEAAVIEWLNANGGEIEMGDIRWYVGERTTKKCMDVHATHMFLLAFTDDNIEHVSECLTSNAWKHGAVRSLLEQHGDTLSWDDLFETVVVQDLKTGKPRKGLNKVNKAFLPTPKQGVVACK